MKEKKFDQKKYYREWQSKNKKKFAVDLNIEEHAELMELLKEKNIKQVDFVRNAFEELKKK